MKLILIAWAALAFQFLPTSLQAAVSGGVVTRELVAYQQNSGAVRSVSSEDEEAEFPIPPRREPPITVRHDEPSHHGQRLSIAPVLGRTFWSGAWGARNQVANDYTTGLQLDIPVSRLFSAEVEGLYGPYTAQYLGLYHRFQQYNLGANGKVYFTRGVFQPFVGGGLAMVHYDQMVAYVPGPANQPIATLYDRTIGTGTLLVGADIRVSDGISIGGRGSYSIPFLNRAPIGNVYPTQFGPSVGTAYAGNSIMDTAYWRLMGSVKVAF